VKYLQFENAPVPLPEYNSKDTKSGEHLPGLFFVAEPDEIRQKAIIILYLQPGKMDAYVVEKKRRDLSQYLYKVS